MALARPYQMCPINLKWEYSSNKCVSVVDFESAQSWWSASGLCGSLGGGLSVIAGVGPSPSPPLDGLKASFATERERRIKSFESILDTFLSADRTPTLSHTVGYDLAEAVLKENTEPKLCWSGIQRLPYKLNTETNAPEEDGVWRDANTGNPVDGVEAVDFADALGDCMAIDTEGRSHVLPCNTQLRCGICQRDPLSAEDSADWALFIVSLLERQMVQVRNGPQEVYFQTPLNSLESILEKGFDKNNATLFSVMGGLVQLDLWQTITDPDESTITKINDRLNELGLGLAKVLQRFYAGKRRLEAAEFTIQLLDHIPLTADEDPVAESASRATGWHDYVAMEAPSALGAALQEAEFTFNELAATANLIRWIKAFSIVIPESTMASAILVDDYWNRQLEDSMVVQKDAVRRIESSVDPSLQKHLILQGRNLNVSSLKRNRAFRVWSPALRRQSLMAYVSDVAGNQFVESTGTRVHPGDNFCLWLSEDEQASFFCQQEDILQQTGTIPLTDAGRLGMLALKGFKLFYEEKTATPTKLLVVESVVEGISVIRRENIWSLLVGAVAGFACFIGLLLATISGDSVRNCCGGREFLKKRMFRAMRKAKKKDKPTTTITAAPVKFPIISNFPVELMSTLGSTLENEIFSSD